MRIQNSSGSLFWYSLVGFFLSCATNHRNLWLFYAEDLLAPAKKRGDKVRKTKLFMITCSSIVAS
jgi:hypothetical protein